MQVAVEISMYPLSQEYEAPIIRFIQMLKQHSGLKVYTNELSTQVTGEYTVVMDCLRDAMGAAFDTGLTCSFVMKVLNVPIETGREVEV